MILAAVTLNACLAFAPQDWSHWRGPTYDGASEVQDLPRTLDDGKGMRWSAEMPGPSAATPIPATMAMVGGIRGRTVLRQHEIIVSRTAVRRDIGPFQGGRTADQIAWPRLEPREFGPVDAVGNRFAGTTGYRGVPGDLGPAVRRLSGYGGWLENGKRIAASRARPPAPRTS